MTAQGLEKQLEEAREEIVALKKKAKDDKEKAKKDIKKLWEMFEKYEEKRKEFESYVDNQAKERGERSSSQFGWGQAVNFVPIFSHAYSLATTRENELAESKDSVARKILIEMITGKYKELEGLYEETIKSYDQEQN